VAKPQPSTVATVGAGGGAGGAGGVGSGRPTAARATFTGKYWPRKSPVTIMMVAAGTSAIFGPLMLGSERKLMPPALACASPLPSVSPGT
jgi:hypothetical protein